MILGEIQSGGVRFFEEFVAGVVELVVSQRNVVQHAEIAEGLGGDVVDLVVVENEAMGAVGEELEGRGFEALDVAVGEVEDVALEVFYVGSFVENWHLAVDAF